MKPFIRALGVDDGHFRRTDKSVPVVAVLMRESVVEGVSISSIEVDGWDATERLLEIMQGKHGSQANVVFLNGVVLGGTNIVDVQKLFEETGKPIICVTRKPPHQEEFLKALAKSDPRKAELAQLLGVPQLLETRRGRLYTLVVGVSREEAKNLIERYQITGTVPEPLRLAHLIATAVTLGDSRGSA